MIYEARINLRNKTKEELIMFVNEDLEIISKYQAELENKDKVINEMAKWLYEDDTSFGYGNLAEVNTQEKIIEYFTNKVEREGK